MVKGAGLRILSLRGSQVRILSPAYPSNVLNSIADANAVSRKFLSRIAQWNLFEYSVPHVNFMESLLADLRDIEGVKSIRRRSGLTLRIELFSREIPDAEAEKIHGDLRSIVQKIGNCLDDAVTQGTVQGWNWVQKPEKKHRETGVKTEKVSDRKPVGHEPAHYTISIRE